MKKIAMIVGLAAALGFNQAEAADWNWKGDIRYRYQSDLVSDPTVTGEHSRDRYRGRVRVGVYPWINEELTGGIQLATGGSGTETTSRNETLDDQFLPDQVYLNEYFINYHPIALDGKVNILLGKRDVANTLMVVNDLVWDSDLAFEGMTLQYGKDVDGKDKEGINAALGYYPLKENNLSSTNTVEQDAYLLAVQAAYTGELSELNYKVGAGYYDYAHFDVDNSNEALGKPKYDYRGKDFNIVELFGTIGGQLTEKTPWKVTVQYAFNNAKKGVTTPNIDNEKRTSYLAGIKIGNAKEVGQWSLGTDYVRIERDALTVLTDSDRNIGTATNLEGVKVSGVYHLVQNMTVGATYFKFNTIDDPTLKKQHALMADVVIKF